MGIAKMIAYRLSRSKQVRKIVYQNKGKSGEAKVAKLLDLLFQENLIYKYINNYIFKSKNNSSYQIDHIVIKESGIFCIETKNYGGWLFGSEIDNNWTQIFKSGKKFQVGNPLKQNKSHIRHLSSILKNKYKINSVIVLVKNNADKIECSNVVNLSDLNDYLLEYDDGTKYSQEEMSKIYYRLLAYRSAISNKEHVENIKKAKTKIQEDVCPKCGCKLVERNGKYGKFYGCSNFPQCRFTKNIK